MQIKREDLNPCTVQLEIVCDPDEVKEGFNKAYKEAAKQIRVPGFRPGHAPKALIAQQISKEALEELAGEIILGDCYKKAIHQLDLKPYSTGAVSLKSISQDDNACEMTAKVPLAPVVELGDYSDLPVEKPSVDVSDKEVEEYLVEARHRSSKREAVSDRGVQEADVAVVNIKSEEEGGEGRNFMIVAGKTFEQLDGALVGMNVEEMKQLELSFPENFQEKDWAGKTIKCQITLRSLNSVKVPEVEEFAEDLKFENVDQLKGRVREMIERQKSEAAAEYVNEQLIETLMSRSSVCVPDTMWETVARQKIQDLAGTLSERKVKFEDYVKEKGMTEEEFIEAQRKEAKTYVMRAQLIQDLYIKENMAISNEDLTREALEMAREYDMPVRELLETLKKNESLNELHYQAIHRKVMEFLNERAQVKEVAAVG